jgi:hypothetical protein
MVGEVVKLMGAEYQVVADKIAQFSQAKPQQESQKGVPQQQSGNMSEPTSNQSGMPMTDQEMMARDTASEGTIQ